MFFSKRKQLLKSKSLDKELDCNGFVKFGKISSSILEDLTDLYQKLLIPDSYGFGFNVGLNTDNKEVRSEMQSNITKIIESVLLEHFINRKVFTATFMNKVSGQKFLLPPHQDWTYTDESYDDSIMCWIPLIDVTAENGALCLMNKSHKLFNYDRAFPLSYMPSPVNSLNYKLLPYMEVVEAKAGEIIVINHKTVHASLPNYTANERLAVGVSISPVENEFIVKCLNPQNGGKTAFTYEVNQNFLVDYRHVDLANWFNQKIIYPFEYKLINEERLRIANVKMQDVEKFVNKNGIIFNSKLKQENFTT